MYAPSFIQFSERLRIYRYRGDLGTTQAQELKEELLNESAREIFIDLSDVTKTDLVAINALAIAHKYKNINLVLPKSAAGRQMFHITKFDRIFNVIPSIPAYLYDHE